MFVFFRRRIDKRVEKNIQNEIWAQILFNDLHVYMTKTTVKINKTTTILNFFRIAGKFILVSF